MINRSGLLVVIGLTCTACAEEPPPVVIDVPSSTSTLTPPVAEPERADYYVYFGSFVDSLSAFQYSLSLALDGSEVKQGARGRYWVVAGPIMRIPADEMAEKHGGRVLTAETLENMMQKR